MYRNGPLSKYGSESSTGAKVKGHKSCLWGEGSTGAKVLGTFAPEERKFQGCKNSMERKFLDFSLPGNECSIVPWNESSTGAKVLSMDFSLPGTKVQRNEKARYLVEQASLPESPSSVKLNYRWVKCEVTC